MADRIFPVPKFFFTVSIGGKEIPFQEVTGLEQQAEHLEYRHGNDKKFVTRKRAGMIKTNNITMKKGVFKGDSELLDIFKKLDTHSYGTQGKPIELVITLQDEKGEPILTWNVPEAVPLKFSGTDLKSDANEIAVETIEFAHSGIEMEF